MSTNKEVQAQIEGLVPTLPPQVLFDLARNESATREWRKAAVALLMETGDRRASHPELRELRLEITAEKTAKEEVVHQIRAAIEENGEPVEPNNGGVVEPVADASPAVDDPASIDSSSDNPPASVFSASVTTKTMYGD